MTSEKKTAVFGPWIVTTGIDNIPADDWEMPVHQDRTSSTCRAISDDGGEVVAFAVTSYNSWDDPIKEAQLSSNARLIAEAGTVFHEVGLSPQELLDWYRELLSFVEGLGATQDAPAWVVQACGYMVRTAALAKHKQL